MTEPSDRPINAPKPGESENEEDSSPASATGSPSSDFIGDAGPAFDAKAAAQDPPPEPPADDVGAELESLEQWEVEVISSLLATKGRVLHAGIGVAAEDWKYTELDLAAIAPPLTRIMNRYPAIAKYAPYADPITIFTAMSAYTARSMHERRQVLAEIRAEQTEEEIEPGGEGAEAPDPTVRSVPAPPAGGPAAPPAPPPPPAPTPREPGRRRLRPGEAEDIDPEAAEWSLGAGN